MTNLLLSKETMSSLQIAEITGKQHSHIMRDIRSILDQGVAASNFGLGSYSDVNGQSRPCYNLTKKGSLILASGYDAKLREAIIDRWEELEMQKVNLSRKELALMIIAAEEENEQLMLTNAKQQNQIMLMDNTITELKKKTDYLELILDSKETVVVSQIAADYGMSAKAMNKILEKLGIQHKVNGQWILYAKFLGEGYVHSKTVQFVRSSGEIDTNMLTCWRQKGRIFLYNLLKENRILPLIEQ